MYLFWGAVCTVGRWLDTYSQNDRYKKIIQGVKRESIYYVFLGITYQVAECVKKEQRGKRCTIFL